MKIKNPEKRLEQFWGSVDRKHIEAIANHVRGTEILDMGCGLGTTTAMIAGLGLNCTGIDCDPITVARCKEKYPNCKFMVANAEELPFENNRFDTIVLRDALHHFYGEADFKKVKNEILRVGKKNVRIIFFEPNVNSLVKTLRRLSAHKDEECMYETAIEIMDDMGYKVIHKGFNTLYSLPLSGGYVSVNFIPNVKLIHQAILGSEWFFERLINALGLGRQLCWRYIIVGEK